ncbi:MAG TPA: BON domain-containing protein [Burkholderiaceae bacterium]
MKTDKQLKADVQAELDWEPSIDAANVGVAVKDGIVTLTGHLNTYAEKADIERVVGRVAGVQAVAVELDVKVAGEHVRSDGEIAKAAEDALAWSSVVPRDKIRIKVEKGWITLTGEVEWEFQRESAVSAVRSLKGVRGVNNLMALKPHVTPTDVGLRIRDALTRHAYREAQNIEVLVNGSTVTLRGKVDAWVDRAAAQGAAWSAAGVTRVINELAIAP